MKKTLLFVVLLITGIGATELAAQTHDGNDFLSECEVAERPVDSLRPAEMIQLAGCDAYVHGVIDGFQTAVAKEQELCIPKSAGTKQTVLIVLKYLRQNPEKLNKPSPWLIVEAVNGAFPCDKTE